jgi:xylan 1,4-beta-xylosidase
MSGDFVSVDSSGALTLEAIRANGVREQPDVNAIATRSDRRLAILLWNYHDDDLPAPAASIDLSVDGLPAGRVRIEHARIDADHSNAYEAWKRMGSPQPPTAQQQVQLERSGQLEALAPPQQIDVANGQVRLPFSLPRQGVSLVTISW